MRGDRPAQHLGLKQEIQFTPHARGSTPHVRELLLQHNVYPACAGIDPSGTHRWSTLKRLPRMRGDRPSASFSSVFIEWFTPHARGSTVIADLCTIVPTVYPA